MNRSLCMTICSLILLIISSSSLYAFQDDSLTGQIKANRAIDTDFNEFMKQIIAAEQKPEYAHWKADIIAFSAEANRMKQETSSVRSKCIAEKVIHSQTCDFASYGQALLNGEMGAISALGDPDQRQPNNNVDEIRPQVERWAATGFAKAREGIAQRTTSMTNYQVDIQRAAAYRTAATKAAELNDWVGAIIFLRHSQLIMDELWTRAWGGMP